MHLSQIVGAFALANLANALAVQSGKRGQEGKDTPWYRDSTAAVAEGLQKRDNDGKDTPWYRDSVAAVAEGLQKRDNDGKDTPWYRDSTAAVAEGLQKRDNDGKDTPWYRDSAASVAEGLDKRGDDGKDTPWYRDSAAAVAEGLGKRADDSKDTPWYRDSAAAVAEGLERREDAYEAKSEGKEAANRAKAYGNMRKESLRRSSEKGKAFFVFTPHPRNDSVDRWHVPAVLQLRYSNAESDADRVSILNNYLYVTARTPKSAAELGFTPTMMMPGLPEHGNEVGYGYALEGQHQHHCADIVADAIDIGKDNMNDFFLKHVIHCLSLIKTLATKLRDPQPVTILTPEAEVLIKGNFRKTID